nr:AAA family ATPase [uncultured Schaedlerella sp.]
MGKFLNSKKASMLFKDDVESAYFVDKTALLDELIPVIDPRVRAGNALHREESSPGRSSKYICITRPRRFGKSMAANMIAAYFGKGRNTHSIFDNLAVSSRDWYQTHINQHNVIHIALNSLPADCTSYRQYIQRIHGRLMHDLIQAYPDAGIEEEDALWDALNDILEYETEDVKFIFVLDEWDFIFHRDFVTDKNRSEYIDFLRNLLKDQPYVELAYMTGVLPIAKYSSGSELNMFLEYDMVTKKKFSEYFGFLDSEVDALFEAYSHNTANPEISRKSLCVWYDGYCTAAGNRLYNPRSVVCALTDNELSNYWTSSGPYDEIFYYIRNNIKDVREDLALMTAGERIRIVLQGYAATEAALETKNQIYSAMVVYGLLTYEDSAVFIPNKELMDKYNELLLTNDSLGYVHRLAKVSEKMLSATLSGDTKTMSEILKFAHDTESPILSYNSEIELSAVVNLVYLSARDRYRVEREDTAGEGFVDFIFYPENRNAVGIILELKVDSTPEEALQQIIAKNYILRFEGKIGERAKYQGKILGVGISYNKKTKKHMCKVIVLRETIIPQPVPISVLQSNSCHYCE